MRGKRKLLYRTILIIYKIKIRTFVTFQYSKFGNIYLNTILVLNFYLFPLQFWSEHNLKSFRVSKVNFAFKCPTWNSNLELTLFLLFFRWDKWSFSINFKESWRITYWYRAVGRSENPGGGARINMVGKICPSHPPPPTPLLVSYSSSVTNMN